MGSYQKLAKLKEETIFELKTLKRWIDENEHNEKGQIVSAVAFLHGKILNLFELYEIE